MIWPVLTDYLQRRLSTAWCLLWRIIIIHFLSSTHCCVWGILQMCTLWWSHFTFCDTSTSGHACLTKHACSHSRPLVLVLSGSTSFTSPIWYGCLLIFSARGRRILSAQPQILVTTIAQTDFIDCTLHSICISDFGDYIYICLIDHWPFARFLLMSGLCNVLWVTRFKTLPKQGVGMCEDLQFLEQPYFHKLQPFPNCPQPSST